MALVAESTSVDPAASAAAAYGEDLTPHDAPFASTSPATIAPRRTPPSQEGTMTRSWTGVNGRPRLQPAKTDDARVRQDSALLRTRTETTGDAGVSGPSAEQALAGPGLVADPL
jgi:hypothetical protein